MQETKPTFFQRFDRQYPSMTRKQQAVADYYRSHYQKAVFFTLAEASGEIGVSEASIIRFARILGYDGYSDMQGDIQDFVAASMRTTVERFSRFETKEGKENDLDMLVGQNEQSLRRLSELVEEERVRSFAESLFRHESVYVVGYESTAGFAEYLGYYLSRIGLPVDVVTERTGNLFPLVRRAGARTLAILLMVARYPDEALRFCRSCRSKGANLAVVSDTADHPLQGFEKHQFSISPRRSDGMSFEIQTSLLVLLQFIIVQAGLSESAKSKTALQDLEKFNSDFRIFG